MKKLLVIASFILAGTSLAQAQNSTDLLAGHPDARNDRAATMNDASDHTGTRHAKHKHHVKHHGKHHRHHRKQAA